MSLQLTTFSILFGYCIFTSMALPITSKPIENTPEDSAWEEWLMNPPNEFHKNKTKKVTPKSIFLFRNKTTITSIATEIQCPPNHRFFDGKCIPTVEIDRDQILLNQLQSLLNNADNTDYDYDYESQPSGSDEQYDSVPVASADKFTGAKTSDDDQQPFKVHFILGESPNQTKINVDATIDDNEAEFWQKFRDSVITTTTTTRTTTINATNSDTQSSEINIAHSFKKLNNSDIKKSDQTIKIIKEDLMPSETNETANDLNQQLAEESFFLQSTSTTTSATEDVLEEALLTTTPEVLAQDYFFTEMKEGHDEMQHSTTEQNLNLETTTIESSGDDEVASSTIITITNYPEEVESTTIPVVKSKDDTLLMQESKQKEMKTAIVPTIKLTDDDSPIDPTVSTYGEASKRFIYHHSENEVFLSKKHHQRFKSKYATTLIDQSTTPYPISTTTQNAISTTADKSTDDEDDDEDYWWLPSGWKLDQSSDKPLLLRFWSQLPSLYSSS